MLCQWCQATRKFVGIGTPVAQSRVIVITSGEPAIIHHEKLYAQSCSSLSQFALPLFGHIKKGSLPRVIEYRTRLLSLGTWQYLFTCVVVKAASHPIRAVLCEARHKLRRGKGFAAFQEPGKIVFVDTSGDDCCPCYVGCHTNDPVAAPGQSSEIGFACLLCCLRLNGK